MNKNKFQSEILTYDLDGDKTKDLFANAKIREIVQNNNSIFIPTILSVKNLSLLNQTLGNNKSVKIFKCNKGLNKTLDKNILKEDLNINNNHNKSISNFISPNNKIIVNKNKNLGNYTQKEKENYSNYYNQNINYKKEFKQKLLKKPLSPKIDFVNTDLSPSNLYKNKYLRKPVVIKFENGFNINNIYNNSCIFNNNDKNFCRNIAHNKETKVVKSKTDMTIKSYNFKENPKHESELYRNYLDLEKKSFEISKRKLRKNLSGGITNIKKDNLRDIKKYLKEIKNSHSNSKSKEKIENNIEENNAKLKIIKFKNKKFVTRLKKHNNKIITIKHFFNKNKLHDFLISGDIDHIVIVWDVSYKYSVNQFIYSIDYHGENLYKLFLVSYEEKENINNYILIYDKSVNIYKLTDGKFIKNVNHFPLKEEKIINIISWKNKDNNLDYIIKCTKYKIVIFNFLDEDIFFELSNYLRSNNNNQKSLCYKSEGCIISYNLGDYLCILSSSMNLEIWDLYNLCLKKQIPIKANLIDDTYLFGIIPWSNRYILLYDGDNNYIYVLDVKFCNVLSKISGSFKNNIRQIFCKKIISKKYGESLLVWCYNRHISLFSSNDFYIKIFDE